MQNSDQSRLRTLIEELENLRHVKRSFWKNSPVPEMLVEIGSHRTPEALAALMKWFGHPESALRNAAALAAQQAIEGLSADQLLHLEALIRSSWSTYYVPDDQTVPSETSSGRRLSSLSSNGRLREKALHGLIQSEDAEALPFVLLRLNDWVPVVRRLAENWFDSMASRIPITSLIASIPILAALTDRCQSTGSRIVQRLKDRIVIETPHGELIGAVSRANPRTRRLVFELLGRQGALEDTEVQSRLLGDPNPILGILLLNSLRRSHGSLPECVVHHALTSRSAMLRRSMLYYLTSSQLASNAELLRVCLTDESKGVRQFVQHYFGREGTKNELRHYYESLVGRLDLKPKILAAAILGFHETGGRWAFTRYEELAKHASMRIRNAVMSACGQLYFDEALPWLLREMEASKESSLTKIAHGLLRRHPAAVSMQQLKGWANDTSRSDGFRLRALVLIGRRGKWERLPVLLELLHVPQSWFKERVQAQLHSWLRTFNRAQVQPTRNQIEAARAELRLVEGLIDKVMMREFQSLLQCMSFL